MAAVNGTSPLGISAADLANMDIESALMMVQTQRANLLESQLKDQMEAVRARNEQINALNAMLAGVRSIRPTGDTDSEANLSSGGDVQVPVTGTSSVDVDQAALSKAQLELGALKAAKKAAEITGGAVANPGGGGGAGASGELTVPSDFKPTAPAGSPAEKPAKALADFIDGGKANPVNYGTAIGGNGEAITGFLNYYGANKALIDAKYSSPAFNLGFNTGSDARDIEKAFESNPNLRKEYETYLRLAVQGGGTAAPPGTPIIDTQAPTNNTTPTQTMTVAELDEAIKKKEAEIAKLQAGQQVSGTTYTSKSLKSALVQYGFITSSKDKMTQAEFDQLIQTISSRIDGLNSTQQLDMLRLQSLTNKRNEAFDIMTNFIKKMQDGRSSIVGNMR